MSHKLELRIARELHLLVAEATELRDVNMSQSPKLLRASLVFRLESIRHFANQLLQEIEASK